MEIVQFIINYWQYIVSGVFSACFLVVNIIQAVRSHDKNKLKNAICRIPEVIREVEEFVGDWFDSDENYSTTTTAAFRSVYKKNVAHSIIKSQVGEKFFNKYMKVFDDAIEDILNTPQKKGGSNDGISKENEER